MGNEYYAVVERDEKGEAVCKLTEPNPTLDALADVGQKARWSFHYTRESGRRYNVYVYHDPSPAVARNEDREAINRRIMDVIAQTPEKRPDKLALWGGILAGVILLTALTIYYFRNGLIIGIAILSTIAFIIMCVYFLRRLIR